jgi:uncharacterized MAPEG superfamily protein
MTIAELCLPAAVLIYIAAIGAAKGSDLKAFNNGDPRNAAFYASGFRKRALGAHNNGIEDFPLFAAAVLLAEMRHANQGVIDALAVGFIVLRIAYVAAYLGDKPTLRSVIWCAAFAANLAIFFAPVYARGAG